MSHSLTRFVSIFSMAGVLVSCTERLSSSDGGFGTTRQAVQTPADPKDPVKSGMPAILRTFIRGDTTPDRFEGSAVLLTNEWVLTAAHVLTEGGNPGPTFQMKDKLWVSLDGDLRSFTRDDVLFHPTWSLTGTPGAKDMALIRVSPPFNIGGSNANFIRDLSTADRAGIEATAAQVCGSSQSSQPQQGPDKVLLRCRTNSTTLKEPGPLPNSTIDISNLIEYNSDNVIFGGDSGGPALEAPGDPEVPSQQKILGLSVLAQQVGSTGTGGTGGTLLTRSFMEPVVNFAAFANDAMSTQAGALIAFGQATGSSDPFIETFRVLDDGFGNLSVEIIKGDGTKRTMPIPPGPIPLVKAWFPTPDQMVGLAGGALEFYAVDADTTQTVSFVTEETSSNSEFVSGFSEFVDTDGLIDFVGVEASGGEKVFFGDTTKLDGLAFVQGDFDADGTLDQAWLTDPPGNCSQGAVDQCLDIRYRLSSGLALPNPIPNSFIAPGTNVEFATGNFNTSSWETSSQVGDEIALLLDGKIKNYSSTNGRTSLPSYQGNPPNPRIPDIAPPTGRSFTHIESFVDPGGSGFSDLRVWLDDGSILVYDGTPTGWVLDQGTPTSLSGLPTDFVVVLDSSGSMSAQDFVTSESNDITRLGVAELGADLLGTLLGTGDALFKGHRVGVVSYNTSAIPLTSGLIDVNTLFDPTSGAFADAVSSYHNTGATGSTSIGSGIQEALALLSPTSSTVHRRAIFLLTDGRQNTSPCIGIDDGNGGIDTGNCTPTGGDVDIIAKGDPRLQDISVCSLGMGRVPGAVDGNILQTFSDAYLDATSSAFDPQTAIGDFAKCLVQLSGLSPAKDPSGILRADQVAAAPETYASAGDKRLTFIANWSSPVTQPGDMRILVNQPNGDLLVPAPRFGALRPGHHVQRVEAPATGTWRTQIVRANTRIVNGFTTDSIVDTSRGVGLVRREIQRLCPDGCNKVLYFEDGRVNPSSHSVYADALQAEVGTHLVNTVTTYNESGAAAFNTALATHDYDLLVYAHQLSNQAEPYDQSLLSTLCNTTTPAIFTDTRGVTGENNTVLTMHFCAGTLPSASGKNYDTLGVWDGTLLDSDIALGNPGYEVFSYSIAAVPFDSVPTTPHLGASQLEANHERFFVQSSEGITFFFGSVVSFSADKAPQSDSDAPFRSRKTQRWGTQIHFEGFSPLQPIMVPAAQGAGLTLRVSAKAFAPPGGITSAVVKAVVAAPTMDLSQALAQFGCDTGTQVAGDPIPGTGRSVNSDSIPIAVATYTLNDAGTQGDTAAGDRVWSLTVPSLGAKQGNYEIRYTADFTFTDAQGVSRTMHRETQATQYVGAELPTSGQVCTTQCGPSADHIAPVFTLVPPAITVSSCASPVIGQATATDECGTVTVNNDAPTVFPLGTTTVTWYAEDSAGNIATATQLVTTQSGGAGCCPRTVKPTEISAGGEHTCAVMGDTANVFCWGENANGQLGDGTIVNRATPVKAGQLAGVTVVSAGRDHTCAVVQNGDVYCWGEGLNGRLGNGSTLDKRTPTRVTGLPAAAVSIAAGQAHSCAALSNGQVWCWGANPDGRLGNNSLLSSSVPVQAQGLTTAVEVGAGELHSCARLTSGQVWCWGAGLNGRLGNGSILNRKTPVQVTGLVDAKQLSVGADHSCSVRNSGDVVCWGLGLHGELGRGSILDALTPVAVSSSLPAGRTVQVDAGDNFTCAVTSDGSGYCWGSNLSGQLGDGTILGRLSPVRVTTLSGAAATTAGDNHTCAAGEDGTLSCWGSNIDHQLGVSASGNATTPTNLCSP